MFLKSIDGTTAHLRSAGDVFRDALRLEGTCPAPVSINDQVAETEIVACHRPHACNGVPAGTFTLVEEFCNIGPNTLTLLKSLTTTLDRGECPPQPGRRYACRSGFCTDFPGH